MIQAERAFRQARRRCLSEFQASTCGYELGLLLNMQGRWAEAEDALQNALMRLGSLAGRDRAVSLASSCQFQLALTALGTERLDEAKGHFETSLSLDKSSGDEAGQTYCHRGLEEVAKRARKPRGATDGGWWRFI
jgi:tetratricopeptide (TPR) repeat protein